jgi:hypothetical protein
MLLRPWKPATMPDNAAGIDLECLLDLRGSAAEDYEIVRARGAHDEEAVRQEPVGDLVHVTGAEAEAISILLGREPLVVRGGARILLVEIELHGRALLRGRGNRDHRDVRHFQRGIGGTMVDGGARLERHSAPDPHRLPSDNRTRDSIRRGGEGES